MASKTKVRASSPLQQPSPQRRPAPQARRAFPRRWRAPVSFGALAVAIIAAAIIYVGHNGTANQTAVAASSALGPLTANLPTSAMGSFTHVSGTVYRQDGKPVLLFIGAQYCPFCAAERWPIVKALARFGTWSGLATGHSTAGTASFSQIPTFDLLNAIYTSKYVSFQSKDIADNNSQPLQTLTAQQQTLFNTYDSAGSIPMVYVDGYALIGSDYSPSEIQGQAFSSLQTQLQQNQGTPFVNDANAEANLLTAFLCKADGNAPQSACSTAVIQTIERGLR